MNAVSEIDAVNAEQSDQPDIILGEDWDEQARDDMPEAAAKPKRRGWISLNSSPLARKIITFNLLALVVLVGGVLYLNQFREGLVVQRERGMVIQAKLIAKVFEVELPVAGAVDLAADIPSDRILTDLGLGAGGKVFVFNSDQTIIAASIGKSTPDTTDIAPYGTFITDFLNLIWEKISGLFGPIRTNQVLGVQALARQSVPFALAGETKSLKLNDTSGNLLFAVATPIRRKDEVLGALVLTTASGEINQIVRREREQVLQMFVVAILVSIGLSLVLASTIANPLRDLAAAAEMGRSKNARQLSPNRVRIPDMTGRPDEIGRLSGALRSMITALYDRIESNEQFAADVAHEIKNPLSSLRSAVDTLRVEKDDANRGRLLSVIEHDVRRMDRLVSDISNASRLDSELVKEEMRPFNLVTTLENLVTYNRLEAEDAGVEFIADLPEKPILIQGLEERLAQVFVNLITNALSFCEDGDAVKIWARERDNRVLIVVEDTGPGIPEDALGKVFSRCYSDRPNADFGNHSGLGLAISRQIVEAHGGVIWAENIRPTEADITSEPRGARFVVGLPV